MKHLRVLSAIVHLLASTNPSLFWHKLFMAFEIMIKALVQSHLANK